MAARYRVTLTKEEREELEALTRRGKIQARRFINARALLLCDAGAGGPAWNVADVAAALGVSSRSIEHLKKRGGPNLYGGGTSGGQKTCGCH